MTTFTGKLLGERPIKVACVGGGQLGRMMNLEAPRLNIEMSFLDPLGSDCPAAQTSPRVYQGSLQDAAAIQKLAVDADVVTVEIEHVNVEVLEQLEGAGANVQPSARVLGLIRDKLQQKQHFVQAGLAVPAFVATPTVEAIHTAARQLGLPLMLKSRKGGYDGKGNAVLKEASETAIGQALSQLGVANTSSSELDLYAEGWIDFACEIAVMVVRSSSSSRIDDGRPQTKSYPAVNAIQTDSICRVVLAPARHVSAAVRQQAEALAQASIDSLGAGASGVFGVEMFVTRQGDVLLNEVAPRPHNTGHYTQDAAVCSQFENHLRAVCGLPLGQTTLSVEAAAMVNVLGSASMEATLASSQAALDMPIAAVHWYGKQSCRVGRKMGHINLAGTVQQVDTALATILELEGVPQSVLPGPLISSSLPLVGVIMGSQSDLPTMNAGIQILRDFGVPYQVDIVSAHRTPDKLMDYSRSAADRGLRVIIAGAGGAAHLPGMVASMTPLPVVGVPVKTSTLSGVDSLYSIVQMPRGIPVATVAIGNATNAGLLAVRILAASRPQLLDQMKEYQRTMKQKVDDSSAKLLELGSDAFLEQMENKNQAVNV